MESQLKMNDAIMRAEQRIEAAAATACILDHADKAATQAAKAFIEASFNEGRLIGFKRFIDFQQQVMGLAFGPCETTLRGEAIGISTVRVGTVLAGDAFVKAFEDFERKNGKMMWSN